MLINITAIIQLLPSLKLFKKSLADSISKHLTHSMDCSFIYIIMRNMILTWLRHGHWLSDIVWLDLVTLPDFEAPVISMVKDRRMPVMTHFNSFAEVGFFIDHLKTVMKHICVCRFSCRFSLYDNSNKII